MKIDWTTKRHGNIEISTFAAITPKGVVINPEYQDEYNDYKKQRIAEKLILLVIPDSKRTENGKLNMRDASNRYFMKKAMNEDLQFLEGWYNYERRQNLCITESKRLTAEQITRYGQKKSTKNNSNYDNNNNERTNRYI